MYKAIHLHGYCMAPHLQVNPHLHGNMHHPALAHALAARLSPPSRHDPRAHLALYSARSRRSSPILASAHVLTSCSAAHVLAGSAYACPFSPPSRLCPSRKCSPQAQPTFSPQPTCAPEPLCSPRSAHVTPRSSPSCLCACSPTCSFLEARTCEVKISILWSGPAAHSQQTKLIETQKSECHSSI